MSHVPVGLESDFYKFNVYPSNYFSVGMIRHIVIHILNNNIIHSILSSRPAEKFHVTFTSFYLGFGQGFKRAWGPIIFCSFFIVTSEIWPASTSSISIYV